MNLAAWLARAGSAYPTLPAVALGDTVVASYAELVGRSARLASSLRRRLGLAVGDRVGLCASNCPEYLELLFGCWWAGLVAVPVNAKLHGAEMQWILDNAGASLAFASAGPDTALGTHQPASLERSIRIGSPEYTALFDEEPAPLARVAPDALAWLFYTSGTTGRPKGAMITHRNLASMSLAHLAVVDPTAPGDAILHAAPMSHGSGLYILPHVLLPALHVVPESGGFDPSEIFSLLAAHQRTSMFAAPTMIKRLVDSPAEVDPAHIRTIVWGGAPMHVADIHRALDRFGPRFAQIYGQGESPMTISVLSRADIADSEHPRWPERIASAGVASPVVEIRIAGPDGEPCADGEAGEVLVRGDPVVPGYWRNPVASAAALAGGWLHTGDVGALDRHGYLTLLDRSKDLIISGGSNIYPREVEEVLLTHPDVEAVSVIGRPDDEWGEVVVAYVVGDVRSRDLDAVCLEHIARFKRPSRYEFVDELPKNSYGKVLKTALRALDRERAGAGDTS